MSVLTTKFLWDIVGKPLTGQIPEILSHESIQFNFSDFILNSTTIQFLADGDPISKFDLLEDDRVFMEERLLPVNATTLSFENTVKDLNRWVTAINGAIDLAKAPQANHTEELDTSTDEITLKFTLKAGLKILLDSTWKRSDDTIDFGPRVEATVPWPDFLNYVDSVNALCREIAIAKLS